MADQTNSMTKGRKRGKRERTDNTTGTKEQQRNIDGSINKQVPTSKNVKEQKVLGKRGR